jgi:hypothetical protein
VKSCWLIEFEDGTKMIISEEFYKQEQDRNWAGKRVACEQHWFIADMCLKRNRGIPHFDV